MEQFEELKWSWLKYEKEERNERILNFEIIADRDPLIRTVNEIHVCTLPKKISEEYNYLKTTEQIAENAFNSPHGLKTEVEDPRKYVTKRLKLANELVKDYGYKSELTENEQIIISQSSLSLVNSEYNQRLTKNVKAYLNEQSKSSLSLEVEAKWKKEADLFNKCAEIYFYRHISELNDLLNSDTKSFLLTQWKSLECELSEQRYQVIAMLLRQKTWKQSATMSIELSTDLSQHFVKQNYIVPIGFFPQIQRYSISRLQLNAQHLKNHSDLCHIEDIEENVNIKLSFEVLAKLFLDENEFSTAFRNSPKGTIFMSTEVVPPKSVNTVDALEEIVRKILISNIEWFNINNYNLSQAKTNDNKTEIDLNESIHAQKIDEFMEKIYARFKRRQGQNVTQTLFKMIKNDLHLSLLLLNEAVFYLSEEETPVNVSIKLEFQTKFGAEKMTKMELLKEWIQQMFSKNSITLRYRIDARTMEILSITQLTIAEIEKELHESYNFDPNESFEVLFNTLNTIRNLPHGDYMIQARSDGKLYIHKTSNQGKLIISTDDININSSFTRKWIPCDMKFPTFIHINLKIAPCCFPVSIGTNNNRLKSLRKSSKKKVPVVGNVTSRVIIKKKRKFKKKKKLQIKKCCT